MGPDYVVSSKLARLKYLLSFLDYQFLLSPPSIQSSLSLCERPQFVLDE